MINQYSQPIDVEVRLNKLNNQLWRAGAYLLAAFLLAIVARIYGEVAYHTGSWAVYMILSTIFFVMGLRSIIIVFLGPDNIRKVWAMQVSRKDV